MCGQSTMGDEAIVQDTLPGFPWDLGHRSALGVILLRIQPPLLRINFEQQTCPFEQKTLSTSYAACVADDGQVGGIRPDKLTAVAVRGDIQTRFRGTRQ
jgi:hypothetical protein